MLTAHQGLRTFSELNWWSCCSQVLLVKGCSSFSLRSSDTVVCCREVFFESNGVPRVVEVVDRQSYESDASKSARRPARDKADPLVAGSVAAPMGGEVIEVKVKPGAQCWPRLCHLCSPLSLNFWHGCTDMSHTSQTCPKSAQCPARDKANPLLRSSVAVPLAGNIKVNPGVLRHAGFSPESIQLHMSSLLGRRMQLGSD